MLASPSPVSSAIEDRGDELGTRPWLWSALSVIVPMLMASGPDLCSSCSSCSHVYFLLPSSDCVGRTLGLANTVLKLCCDWVIKLEDASVRYTKYSVKNSPVLASAVYQKLHCTTPSTIVARLSKYTQMPSIIVQEKLT